MSVPGREPEFPQLAGDANPADPGLNAESPGSIGSDSLEIAHVLFTDLVGYSLLSMERQKSYLAQFQSIVRDSPQFLAAQTSQEIVVLPTGDGIALVFLRAPLAPLKCALEIAARLKGHPHLQVRMGINSGPVFHVLDVNAQANVAGTGINMAQRVMDCGDAGHILISKGVADMLMQFSEWAAHLTDAGEISVKHGTRLHLYNLVFGDVGRRELPRKLRVASASGRRRPEVWIAAVAAAAMLLTAVTGWRFLRNPANMPAPGEASIAVLPFADMSQEKNQAYFGEGMAEELLEGLARVPGLRVAARSSSFRFKDGGGDFRTIRDQLSVTSILQGSVRRQGNRARISVQLINASDGFQMWADVFDRDMSDILGVQQDIARTVIGKLKLTGLAGKQLAAPAGHVNAEAYDAYLQGLYLDRRGSRDNLQKAAALYERSLQLDPGSARAWASLGSNRTDQAQHNYVPRDEGYLKARQALDRALALDATLASPNSTLAWIAMYHDWNWDAASFYSHRALSLDPGSTAVINTAATLAMVLGRREESIALYRRAIRIDPLSSAKLMNEGGVLYYAGHFEEAESSLRKALTLAPDRDDVHLYLALVRLAQGKNSDALNEADKEKNPAHRLFALSLAHHALRDEARSNEELAKLVSTYGWESSYLIGELYAYRGETEHAFEWLERAYTARDSDLTEIKGNPLFHNVDRDPRYAALLKKIGLPV